MANKRSSSARQLIERREKFNQMKDTRETSMFSLNQLCRFSTSDEMNNHEKQQESTQPNTSRRRANTVNCHLVASLILTNFVIISSVDCQCPEKTMTSFERIGGVTIKDAPLTILYSAPNSINLTQQQQQASNSLFQQSNQLADLSRQLATGGASAGAFPITAECNNRCRRNARCRAFLVDYGRHTCWSVEHPATGAATTPSSASPPSLSSSLSRSPTPIHLSPTTERTAYFEKVCLNLPPSDCERAWIFERTLAYHIYGSDDKIIDDVPNRLRCQEHCLNERDFKCRSGEYDYHTMQCRLSMADRHSKPALFRPTSSNLDYFENQCVHISNQCDSFDRFDDLDLGRAEIMRIFNTSEQCQQYCTQTIKAFICRSFTWSPQTGQCFLNSANTQMVGGLDKLIAAPGLVYFQRNECIDLKLECDTSSMTLNLRTNEPFRGRMYVRDEPNACETQGRSSLVSSLSIPFQSQARCAQRVSPSRYSSVVVVQQHPLIQRKSDRYIKLVCDFQTANKTITSTYNVVANPWTSTALINATSFAPKIRLRITDKFGNDITGAKLGDELQLRIEAESDSVYDMVARSVLAKSGQTDESIVLIDRDGCPADFRIFPPLRKLSKRVIIGKFDAFKFSSDVVVRFQVDVQFCLNSCPPTNCDQAQSGLLLNVPELADSGLNISDAINRQHVLHSTSTTLPPSLLQNPLRIPTDSIEPYLPPPVNTPPDRRTTSPIFRQPQQQPSTPPMPHHQHQQLPDQDSLDQQVFDQSQPRQLGRSASDEPMKTNNPPSEQQQQPLINNELGAADAKQQQQETSQNSHSRSRRRRSIEPIPTTPKHVPLQREIIVMEGPGAAGQQQSGDQDVAAAAKNNGKKSKAIGQPAPENSISSIKANNKRHQQPADQSAAPTPASQLNSKSDQERALLCTTWSSLVFSILAFCGLQLLTIGLCLATWLHKQRRTDTTNMKTTLTGPTHHRAAPFAANQWTGRPFH